MDQPRAAEILEPSRKKRSKVMLHPRQGKVSSVGCGPHAEPRTPGPRCPTWMRLGSGRDPLSHPLPPPLPSTTAEDTRLLSEPPVGEMVTGQPPWLSLWDLKGGKLASQKTARQRALSSWQTRGSDCDVSAGGRCHCCLLAPPCLPLCDPVDCTRQAPLSVGVSRQEHWSSLPFPSSEDPPNPEIKPRSPALAGRFFTI